MQLGLDKKPLKQVLVDLSRMKAAQSANNKQGDAPYVMIPRFFDIIQYRGKCLHLQIMTHFGYT